MKGVQFVVDSSGRKTAVQIDLKKQARLWEALSEPKQRAPARPRDEGGPCFRAEQAASERNAGPDRRAGNPSTCAWHGLC